MDGTQPRPPDRPIGRPEPGDQVRHICTGDVGTLDHYTRQTAWALVRWSVTGPGMTRADGLSVVAPGLLVRHNTAERP